jgi:hypothetical protein
LGERQEQAGSASCCQGEVVDRSDDEKIAALVALRDAVLGAIDQNDRLIAEAKRLISECLPEETGSVSRERSPIPERADSTEH